MQLLKFDKIKTALKSNHSLNFRSLRVDILCFLGKANMRLVYLTVLFKRPSKTSRPWRSKQKIPPHWYCLLSTAIKKVSKSIRPLFRTQIHNMSKKRHLCCFTGSQKGLTGVNLTSARGSPLGQLALWFHALSCPYCPHLTNQTPRRLEVSTNRRRRSPSHTQQNVSDWRSLEPKTVPGRMPGLVSGFETRWRPRIKGVVMQLGVMTTTRGGQHGHHP